MMLGRVRFSPELCLSRVLVVALAKGVRLRGRRREREEPPATTDGHRSCMQDPGQMLAFLVVAVSANRVGKVRNNVAFQSGDS